MLNVDAMVVAARADDIGDARRVEDLKHRSPVAWANLFDAYYGKIHRFAWSKLGSGSDADDAAAAVFMRALTAIDSYHYKGTPIVAWLYRIASNVIKERQRKTWRERRNTVLEESSGANDFPELVAPGEDAEAVVRRLDLVEAIGTLTKDQQTVIELIYTSGFSVKEVAQITGKGERAVYYIQARGLMRLKEALG